MIRIIPFSAVRPTRDKAALVASRSYVTYDDQQLTEKLENNPYTFLHIIHPDQAEVERLNGTEKYELVREKYLDFLEEGILKQDVNPAFYLYSQQTATHTFTGIIAGVSVQDYREGRILIHEHTLTRREEMFKNYLRVTGFNAEPVLLMYPDNDPVKAVVKRTMAALPEYEFATTDQSTHKLWPITESEDLSIITSAFAGMEKLYIADGHHRCASSALLADELTAEGRTGPFNHFMAYLIPDTDIHIHGFHRLVKNLGLSQDDFIAALQEKFSIEPQPGEQYSPAQTGEIGFYFSGTWHALRPLPGTYDADDPVASLDAEILSRNVLDPLLNITDLRNDPGVDFIPGDKGCLALESAVDSGKYECGFALYPVTSEQLKRVADAGCIMPPKST